MSDTTQAPAVGARIVAKSFPPVTRHTLALYCGASGDLNPIHVDSDFARDAGFPDVFAHGMLVMAYLGQALTDAVPPASLRSFSTRFVAITRLGARIDCTGEVVEIDPALRYTAAMPEAEKAPAVQRTRELISTTVAEPGVNRVVVAHGPNIAELMDYLPREATLVIFRPLGGGRFEYLASIEPRHWPALLHSVAAR